MTYVWHLQFNARKADRSGFHVSGFGDWYDIYLQSPHALLRLAVLPLYETLSHLHYMKAEIICEISVDTPLEF